MARKLERREFLGLAAAAPLLLETFPELEAERFVM